MSAVFEFVSQSTRIALRNLRARPGFTLLAVLTLALGLGPTTAVYAVFRQVLLRPMNVPNAASLILLQEHSGFETGGLHTHGGPEDDYFAYPALLALRSVDPQLAAVAPASATVVTPGIAQRVNTQLVTGNYFSVLGLRPILGRLLNENDDKLHNSQPVAVLSESYWRSSFGGNPSVLNRVIRLNGNPFQVVGIVAYSGILDGRQASIYVPLSMHAALSVAQPDSLEDPLYRFVLFIGRTPPGATRQTLAGPLNAAWYNWRRDVLHANAGSIADKHGWMQTHVAVADGSRGVSILAEDLGGPLYALQAMTAMVLLIACANLANLLLARAAKRRGELAVRVALGSGHAQLVTAAITEALLLSCGGILLGLPLSWLSLRLLSGSVPLHSSAGAALLAPWQWPVLFFAAALAVITSLLFSAVPAFSAAGVQPSEVLRRSTGIVGSAAARLQDLLVGGAVAFSLLLLVASVFLGWNLYRQTTVNLGLRTDNILTFRIRESAVNSSRARVDQVYTQILSGIQAHGGVLNAAYAEDGLLGDSHSGSNLSIEGRHDLTSDPDVLDDYISPAYLQVLDIPVLTGRDFAETDRAGTEQVAIVNQAFVHAYFAGNTERALGDHFGFGDSTGMAFPIRIIGIVPSIYAESPSEKTHQPLAYLPYAQNYAAHLSPTAEFSATYYIHTVGDPTAIAADIRALVHRVDPALPIADIIPFRQQLRDDVADIRLMAWLSFALGALASLLAAIGLYSVLAFQVATRTREIGLRMAVGASRGRVARLLLGNMLRLALSGMAVGGLLAFFAARLLHAQIADLVPAPPLLYAAACALLLLSAFLAALLPTLRAANTNPTEALRAE